MYAQLLQRVRTYFASPIADPIRDAEASRLVSESMERLLASRTGGLYLGQPTALDFEAAQSATVREAPAGMEEVLEDLFSRMQGLVHYNHPLSQVGVTPQPTLPSLVGVLYAAAMNSNLIWDVVSPRVCEAEIAVASMTARMVGYGDEAGGFFTFGGTGTVLYGMKIGLEKALPGTMSAGVRGPARVICSTAGHYSKINVSGWLGIGTSNLDVVPTHDDQSMDVEAFAEVLERNLRDGIPVAGIIASVGTTDAFAIDDLPRIVEVRDALVRKYAAPYRPHIHADSVIGWAWSSFLTYDFGANPLGFPPEVARVLERITEGLRGLHLVDSIGCDFNKTGYAPNTSSLFVCRDRRDLSRLARDEETAPYLFHSGSYRPGLFTLEASRSGYAALSVLANLKLLGLDGMRAILGHIVAVALDLRTRLDALPHVEILNRTNEGPSVLYRAYPRGRCARCLHLRELKDPPMLGLINRFNRTIGAVLATQAGHGGPLISQTDCAQLAASGDAVAALKSFIISPFAEPAANDLVVRALEGAIQAAERLLPELEQLPPIAACGHAPQVGTA